MKILLFILLIFGFEASAEIRVMTFNTTCSLCNKKQYDKFRYRKHWILDTIKRADPDLISLQEVLLPIQLRWFRKRLKEYKPIFFRKLLIFRYPDPTLFVKKDKFEVLSKNGFWLGPLWGKFSFGWKISLPRRVQYTLLKDRETGRKFYFAGSHFDNADKNKNKSAKMLIKRSKKTELPILFAADTNLKPSDKGYSTLMERFNDSFDYAEKISFLRNSDTSENDACNVEKGLIFPECRVDHVMTSKGHTWSASNWVIDLYKYGKNQKFTSDHRALYVDLKLN